MSETASPWVRDVTDADFEENVVGPSFHVPVVVDFWAPWCQPCRALGPVLERLVHARDGQVLLAKVNTDDAPALAEYFQISAIPSVKVIFQGQVVHEFQGVQPEEALGQLLDKLTAGAAESPLARARALEADAPEEAERLYRELLAADADDMAARVGLAQVLLAQDRPDEVEDLLAPVGSEGEAGAEAERLLAQLKLRRSAAALPDEATLRKRLAADPKSATAHHQLGSLLAQQGKHAEALEALLAAAERDPKLAAGPVREAMVQVFYALGPNHPLANEYRAKLARLLY